MQTPIDTQDFHCPIEATLSVLGGKWTPLVLWHLREETLRFGELRRRIPGITKKMLSQRLQRLGEAGVVHREAYAEVPPRVEYSLTPFGQTLRPVLDAMCHWGAEYLATQTREVAEDVG
ncbi:MAG: transcriptional regulator [Bacteroidetes bacterium]|jgi:DNA-binding HxlR family transcriptional regulator|nr:transcriptional regulator [Bacteroidota bacterium]